MNIFAVSPRPLDCAQALDDRRLVKMVLETAQMLSTASGADFYKPTHANHPCTRWVRESAANYIWTLGLFQELAREYSHRYSRTHKCADHYAAMIEGLNSIPDGPQTPFAQCTPGFEDVEDVHRAYQQYLCHKWDCDKTAPSWTKRRQPAFWRSAGDCSTWP